MSEIDENLAKRPSGDGEIQGGIGLNDEVPRKKLRAYTEASVTDWLVTLFVSILPGINIIALVCWSIFSRRSSVRRNFSLAYLIVAPFSLILTIALCLLFVYFFGASILNHFAEQYGPKIY